jgi:hypothetical protein
MSRGQCYIQSYAPGVYCRAVVLNGHEHYVQSKLSHFECSRTCNNTTRLLLLLYWSFGYTADLLHRCVTQTVFKGVIPEIFNGGEEYQKARDQLWKVCQSWESDAWNEMDLSRVKDLQLRDIIAKRLEELKTAQTGECLKCPQFVKHVSFISLIWLAESVVQSSWYNKVQQRFHSSQSSICLHTWENTA